MLRLIKFAGLAALTLALSACSPEFPSEEPAGASATEEETSSQAVIEPTRTTMLAGVDLTQPVSVIGTEPFWNVSVSSEGIQISRPDDGTLTLGAAEFVVAGDKAVLTAKGLWLEVTAKSCSDGMSDRAYPLSADVRLGEEHLKGCAIPTTQMAAHTA